MGLFFAMGEYPIIDELGPFLQISGRKQISAQQVINGTTVNWLNGQCCLAGSSQTAPRILIFQLQWGPIIQFMNLYEEKKAIFFFIF